MANYVLGVDGGNTKTIALVGRLDGTIVGVGRGGCSDIYAAPSPEAALGEMGTAIAGALRMAGVEYGDLAIGVFSLAGADWPDDFQFLQSALEERGWGQRITVVNDAIGALRAGLLEGPGVVVVCGTGTAIAARSAHGEVWHSSWWQEVQGAHQLGNKALWAVYRSELGIDPPTTLTGAVLRYFEKETPEQVLYEFTKRLGPRPGAAKVGALAKVLLDEAERGDEVARCIVREHGSALGDYALAAARRVGIEGTMFTLALAGGVLRHPSPLLSKALVERVHATSPDALPVFSRFEPAVGALFLALEASGVAVDDLLLAHLTPTLPEASLFAT